MAQFEFETGDVYRWRLNQGLRGSGGVQVNGPDLTTTKRGEGVNSRGITHRFRVVQPARLKDRVRWSDGGKIEGSVGDIQLNDEVRGYEVKDIHEQLQPKTCG